MTAAVTIAIVILSILLAAAVFTTLLFLYLAYEMTNERDEYKKKYHAQLSKNIEFDAEKIADDLLAMYRASKK